MSNAGPAIAIKRFLGLRGSASLAPAGELLPVVQVADVSESPYGSRRNTISRLAFAAAAGQTGFVGFCNRAEEPWVIEDVEISCNVQSVWNMRSGTAAELIAASAFGGYPVDRDLAYGVQAGTYNTDLTRTIIGSTLANPGTGVYMWTQALGSLPPFVGRFRIVLRKDTGIYFYPDAVAATMYVSHRGWYDPA